MADLLIVDDDVDVTAMLNEVLLGLGHEVRTACDGAEGLRLVEERRPDLILLDVEMPVLDGPGMSHRMRRLDAGLDLIPILLVSAAADLHLVALRVGTPYFLAKPYGLPALRMTLSKALAERCPPQR